MLRGDAQQFSAEIYQLTLMRITRQVSRMLDLIKFVPNSNKSWSFPTRAKLAKLSHSLNRLLQKKSSISLFTQ